MKKNQGSFYFEELEPRLLFSGDSIAAAAAEPEIQQQPVIAAISQQETPSVAAPSTPQVQEVPAQIPTPAVGATAPSNQTSVTQQTDTGHPYSRPPPTDGCQRQGCEPGGDPC